jgi:predicted nuclease with RNAse H fold
MPIAGLDLAGVESRPTGFCALADMKAETSLVYADREIPSKIRESNPPVIAIDAPLSQPPRRKSLEERTVAHLTSRQGFNLKRFA